MIDPEAAPAVQSSRPFLRKSRQLRRAAMKQVNGVGFPSGPAQGAMRAPGYGGSNAAPISEPEAAPVFPRAQGDAA